MSAFVDFVFVFGGYPNLFSSPRAFAHTSCRYSSGSFTSSLWTVWRTKNKSLSALDPQVLRDICVAEQNTMRLLEEKHLCSLCDTGKCLPSYSLVLFARLILADLGSTLSCDELSLKWVDHREVIETQLVECVRATKLGKPNTCPPGFSPFLVDDAFGVTDGDGVVNTVVHYTSSIFNTIDGAPRALYDIAAQYDRADNSDWVQGVYDTGDEAFVHYEVNAGLVSDMILAIGSAIVTGFAMLVHTRSIWLTTVGLLQITLSFPTAYFAYSLIAQLKFFPFLNFIGVFVVFAIGCDDIFVAVDKWKNARLDDKAATTEQIAAIALPDAAEAMFLTTVCRSDSRLFSFAVPAIRKLTLSFSFNHQITTAIAFFGTAICPVAPLKMFAIFIGLLVMFNYFMCLLLVFPALCIYDTWRQRRDASCRTSCSTSLRSNELRWSAADGAVEDSFIRRILAIFYSVLHFFRWGILVVVIGTTVFSGYTSSKLALPESSDVRLLDSSNEYEVNYQWKAHLLSSSLAKAGGSRGYVIWGVLPADTGDHNNPGGSR